MNLNQVTVPSLDLAQAVPFYQKLGLRLIVDALPLYVRFECPTGDATFSIHRVEELPGGDGVYVYFEIEDLDPYVQGLVDEQGMVFDELPEDRSWRWREARLRDPDGNRLILYWAGEDRKYPPWRVGGTPPTDPAP
jgi:catechol 2,3-dioxygenase-like lactoylglutathione lyase family enzyme